MEEKELKAALVEHKGDIQKIVDTMKETSGEEKAELQKSLDKANETMGVMQKQLDAIATEQKNAKLEKVNPEVVSFSKDLKKQLDAEAKAIAGSAQDHKEVKFMVKSFLETANASVTTGSLLPWPQLDPELVKGPDRQPFLLEIVARGISNSLTLYYTERKTRTDNSEWVDEGVSPSSQTVLGYTTQSVSMQNLSSFLKISVSCFGEPILNSSPAILKIFCSIFSISLFRSFSSFVKNLRSILQPLFSTCCRTKLNFLSISKYI